MPEFESAESASARVHQAMDAFFTKLDAAVAPARVTPPEFDIDFSTVAIKPHMELAVKKMTFVSQHQKLFDFVPSEVEIGGRKGEYLCAVVKRKRVRSPAPRRQGAVLSPALERTPVAISTVRVPKAGGTRVTKSKLVAWKVGNQPGLAKAQAAPALVAEVQISQPQAAQAIPPTKYQGLARLTDRQRMKLALEISTTDN